MLTDHADHADVSPPSQMCVGGIDRAFSCFCNLCTAYQCMQIVKKVEINIVGFVMI